MNANRFTRFFLVVVSITFAISKAANAQTTVFQDTFGTGNSINPTSAVVATSTTTAFEIAATKAGNTTTTLSVGTLTLGLPSTTSGYIEAQAQFTSSPIVLSSSGQYIQMFATFTDTTNVFNGTASNGESFTTGLYNSNGVALTDGANLWNSGLNTTSAAVASGDAQNWTGNNGQIVYTGSNSAQTSSILARPAATGTDNFNQELGNANSSTVGGATFQTLGGQADPNFTGGTNSDPLLISGSSYTISLLIAYASPTTDYLVETLQSGTGLSGTKLMSFAEYSGTTTITDTFDSLEIGIRGVGLAGNDPAITLPITAITVQNGSGLSIPTQPASVPEPSSYMLAGLGLAALTFIGVRRRKASAAGAGR